MALRLRKASHLLRLKLAFPQEEIMADQLMPSVKPIPADFWEKLQQMYEEEDGNLDTYDFERPRLVDAFGAINEKLKGAFTFCEPVGRGGTGLVIRILDSRLSVDRALKVPRPKKDDPFEPIRSEMRYLNALRHENIIPLYHFDEVTVPGIAKPYPFFVMDYIDGAQDLRKRVERLVADFTESKDLGKVTIWVANTFHRLAGALEFLHHHDTIHFDVKPSNVLIDRNDKVILGDLGLAQRKTDSSEEVSVGFTLYYAHPDLRAEYGHMSSKNRVMGKRRPRDFRFLFDIFAFGKSLLEVLALIDSKFPDAVPYDYTFAYLHLAGCRMLDGRNMDQDETKRVREEQVRAGQPPSAYRETCLQLERLDLSGIKYDTFEEVRRDLEKVLVREPHLDAVPELNEFYVRRIQSSDDVPAPFSKRVKQVVEHPVFARLASVPQLGLLSTIFPTARHTRLDHSLGAFRNSCLYVRSLYNDPYNPLFRQLFSATDLKCGLAASLLHDLGQYPLAHELEEFSPDLKHEIFTPMFLDNPSKDVHGNTIREILENEEWGWGVKLENLKELLAYETDDANLIPQRGLKAMVLSSLVNGPIDVDKLDYLLRDSRMCYLKYGELIDVDRLIRSLTVIISHNGVQSRRFTIGTYEKGQSAAESLAFARYLLYQSLYWHHTARGVRAMLREVIDSVPKGGHKGKTFAQQLGTLLGVDSQPGEVAVRHVLNLLGLWAKRGGQDSEELVSLIKQRNYYKRILTIHSEVASHGEGRESLLDKFRSRHRRAGFQEALQKEIKDTLDNFIAGTAPSSRVSLLAPERTNHVSELLTKGKRIICDCPRPVYGASEMLRFIPEPERLQKNYQARVATGERISEVWEQVYFRLMNIASKGRVFCHPDMRDSLMAALGPEGIRTCVEKVVARF
jgi:HD superfamily phosphohydrolase/tRNA A-37 threonylcarbamoyl transferase component Bud32